MGRRKRKPPRRRTITNSARAEFATKSEHVVIAVEPDGSNEDPSELPSLGSAIAVAFDTPFEGKDDPITTAVRTILKRHCKPYADDRKLKDMGGGDGGVRILIAHDVDRAFPDLNPRFIPEDVSSEDTLGTLAARVAERFSE